jgi:hypothetical protein
MCMTAQRLHRRLLRGGPIPKAMMVRGRPNRTLCSPTKTKTLRRIAARRSSRLINFLEQSDVPRRRYFVTWSSWPTEMYILRLFDLLGR